MVGSIRCEAQAVIHPGVVASRQLEAHRHRLFRIIHHQLDHRAARPAEIAALGGEAAGAGRTAVGVRQREAGAAMITVQRLVFGPLVLTLRRAQGKGEP